MPEGHENSDSSTNPPVKAPDPKPEPKPETKTIVEQVEQHETATDTEKLIRGLFGEHEAKINARFDAFEKSHSQPKEEKKEGADGLQKKDEPKPANTEEHKPEPKKKSGLRLWRTV